MPAEGRAADGRLDAWKRRFELPAITLPRWAAAAPDRLVYVSTAPGRPEVFAWNRAAGEHRQVTDRHAGTPAAALEPSGDAIWWFDDTDGDELGHWAAQGFEGGAVTHPTAHLPPAQDGGLALSRSAAFAGRVGDRGSSLLRIDSTGAISELLTSTAAIWVASCALDDELVAIEHREHGDVGDLAVRVVDRTGARIADLCDGPGRELAAGDWSPVPGDECLVVHRELGEHQRPWLWFPRHGALEELDVAVEGELVASWGPDGTRLLLRRWWRGRSQLFLVDRDGGNLVELPTPRGHVAAAAQRPDGDVWFEHSSSVRPPAVLSLARGRIVDREPAADVAGTAVADLDVDGVHCLLAEPPAPRPHPTIFVLHGGPANRDADAWSPMVQAWVDHGFAVVQVNYRGSTGYGRPWREALKSAPGPGLVELGDLAAVRDRLVADGISDADRMVLEGGSWGGYLVLLGLALQADLWRLGIAVVPVADWFATYEDELEHVRATDRALFGGSPDERPDYYRERSPLTYAERLQAPVMVVFGLNDAHCPPRQVERYLHRLAELGKDHVAHAFEGGHGASRVVEQVAQLEAQLRFVAEHIGEATPHASRPHGTGADGSPGSPRD